MDGVKRRLHPGKPNNTNLYEATPEDLQAPGIDVLPQNLLEAITALEQDEVVQDGTRRAARRRVHRAEADGMDRVRAPCLGLGNQPLRGVLLMCGIVGLLLKNPAWDERLGELLVPMLVGMTDRGPDSAGLAVFATSRCRGTKTQPVPAAWRAGLGGIPRALAKAQCPASTPLHRQSARHAVTHRHARRGIRA